MSDPLRYSAAALANYLNAERGEDVLRIAAEAVGSRPESLTGAQLLCASPYTHTLPQSLRCPPCFVTATISCWAAMYRLPAGCKWHGLTSAQCRCRTKRDAAETAVPGQWKNG